MISSGRPLAPLRLRIPVLLTLVGYIVFVVLYLARFGYNVSGLIGIGSADEYSLSGKLPAGLVVTAGDGYDGAYFYRIALGMITRESTDVDSFRYQRIGYPALSAALSLGQVRLLPLAMLLVNLLALAAGTWVFSRLIVDEGGNPLFSLLYGLNPGMLLGVQLDLALPVEMALGFGAVLSWRRGSRCLTWLLLAASMLTSESAILFVATLVVGEVSARRYRSAGLLSLSIAPYLGFQAVLTLLQGGGGLATTLRHITLPGEGLVFLLSGMGDATLPLREVLIHKGSVLVVAVSMLGTFLLSLFKLRRGYRVSWCGAMFHSGASLLGSAPIWEAFSSAARVFSGAFPFAVLGYLQDRDLVSRALLFLGAVLGLFTVARLFLVTPVIPFVLTP